MKIGLFADIHSNLEAYQACLDHARGKGIKTFAYLGDLVGYGADPGAVVDLAIETACEGCVLIRGNHDRAVVTGDTSHMNAYAAEAAKWTAKVLDERQRQFLTSLPLTVNRWRCHFVHGSADAPSDFIYVTDETRAFNSINAARANWVLCGHVHRSALYYMGQSRNPVAFTPVAGTAIPVHPRRQWLAVIGAVGQPRDGNTDATYAVLDLFTFTLTYHRVAYDWPSAAAKIRAAGLPERLASRLGRGE